MSQRSAPRTAGRHIGSAAAHHPGMTPYRLAAPCLLALALAACGSITPPGGGDDDDDGPVIRDVPHAVTVAQTTTLPGCTLHVDAALGGGDGSADRPFSTI